MANKRARSDSLTGGTLDVNPQWLSGTAAQSGADTTATTQVVLPIQRIAANAPNNAVVLEVLKIWLEHTNLPASASATETTDTIVTAFSTTNTGTTNAAMGDSNIFGWHQLTNRSAFTAAGTYYTIVKDAPFVLDLTDGAGHGILVATDSIFVQVQSAGTGNTNTVPWKILYRWKRVSLTEYIGIVQSQQ
jgi:hypothetical protein